MPLTPLIDVIFILVMFFLLSSAFGVWRLIDVGIAGPQPSASQGDKDSPAPILITLRPDGTASGIRIQVNGLRFEESKLGTELERLVSGGASAAIVLPSEDLSFENAVRILDAARLSGLKSVSLQIR
ncbi:ExbD/TolR family protein [Roseibium denhamense]|nr:biopolymer transporter ExbD [Roseibium denhamense]